MQRRQAVGGVELGVERAQRGRLHIRAQRLRVETHDVVMHRRAPRIAVTRKLICDPSCLRRWEIRGVHTSTSATTASRMSISVASTSGMRENALIATSTTMSTSEPLGKRSACAAPPHH